MNKHHSDKNVTGIKVFYMIYLNICTAVQTKFNYTKPSCSSLFTTKDRQ